MPPSQHGTRLTWGPAACPTGELHEPGPFPGSRARAGPPARPPGPGGGGAGPASPLAPSAPGPSHAGPRRLGAACSGSSGGERSSCRAGPGRGGAVEKSCGSFRAGRYERVRYLVKPAASEKSSPSSVLPPADKISASARHG